MTGNRNVRDMDAQQHDRALPPDAAERDRLRRESTAVESVVLGEDICFVTRGLENWRKTAVIAVLTAARTEESGRARRVARRERAPWERSQRTPEGISDLLADG